MEENSNFEIATLEIPKLGKKEINIINNEINDVSERLVDSGEKMLMKSPNLSEQELAINLAKEDLKNTKKLSFKLIYI